LTAPPRPEYDDSRLSPLTLKDIWPAFHTPERRRHPRVPLNLPVRLRWIGALGQTLIQTQTLDVSRGGMLAPLELTRNQAFHLHSPAWATLPYDEASMQLQPESPVRVTRFRETPSGAFLLGLEFKQVLDASPAREQTPPAGREQRRSIRSTLAVPIRVHWEGSPWPEESMTVDVSSTGVLFCARRLYAPGDEVSLTLPRDLLPGIASTGDRVRSRIARRMSLPDYDCVGAEFLSAA
jgi:hypothetical protein